MEAQWNTDTDADAEWAQRNDLLTASNLESMADEAEQLALMCAELGGTSGDVQALADEYRARANMIRARWLVAA